MNRNRKKAAAATLAAGMAVVLGAGTVMAAASTGDNGLQKEETVYVNTTADGEVTDVTVSDWLKTQETVQILRSRILLIWKISRM